MEEMTLLTLEQYMGENRLDIIKKYGEKCAIKDFAILLGGLVSDYYYTDEGTSLKERVGDWWTKTPDCGQVGLILDNGFCYWCSVTGRYNGIRPALPYSSISAVSSNGVRGINGILEVEYGEYPQTIVSKDYARTLERECQNGTINQTGKKYTTDSVKYDNYDTPFQARTHIEYEYNGKKYIRFVGDYNGDGKTLSDGRKVGKGKVYWVEVEPIKWLVDEKENIALCKNIIVSGIQFSEKRYHSIFENTRLYKFLNEIFAKDIIPSKIGEKIYESNREEFKENKSLTPEERTLIAIENEIKKVKAKVDKIDNFYVKEAFRKKIAKIYDDISNRITKKEFDENGIKLSIENIEAQTMDSLCTVELDVEKYLIKEKYINDINVLLDKIKPIISNIDLNVKLENTSLSAVECIFLLYSKINDVLKRLDEVDSKNIISKLNDLSNKIINIIKGNIKVEENNGLLVISFEMVKRIIINEFSKFDIKFDEYIKNLESYNQQQQMLDEFKKDALK